MDFKMEKNRYWICGLVPIGKEDYRGPLSRHKLICLEEEKEALMTPSKKDLKVRFFGSKKEMDLHEKEIEVCFEHFLFSLSIYLFGSISFPSSL